MSGMIRPAIPRLVSQLGRGKLAPQSASSSSQRHLSTTANRTGASPCASPRLMPAQPAKTAVRQASVSPASTSQAALVRPAKSAIGSTRNAAVCPRSKPATKLGRPAKLGDKPAKRKRHNKGTRMSRASKPPKCDPPQPASRCPSQQQPPLAHAIAARQADLQLVPHVTVTGATRVPSTGVVVHRPVVRAATRTLGKQPQSRALGESLSGCEAFDMFAEWFSEYGFVDAPSTSDVPGAKNAAWIASLDKRCRLAMHA